MNWKTIYGNRLRSYSLELLILDQSLHIYSKRNWQPQKVFLHIFFQNVNDTELYLKIILIMMDRKGCREDSL